MNPEDISNPFIECELCETMVRFNDFQRHMGECMDMIESQVPRLMPMNVDRLNAIRRRRYTYTGEEDGEEGGDEREDDERSDDYDEYDEEEEMETAIRRENLESTNENNVGDSDDADEESVDENEPSNAPNIEQGIPQMSFQFTFYRPPDTENTAQNGDTGFLRTESSIERFDQIIENIRNGTLLPADIGSFLNDDNGETNSTTLPPLPNLDIDNVRNILNELEPLIPLLNGANTAPPPPSTPLNTPFLNSFPFATLSSLLPIPMSPLEIDNSYEYNLLLADRLGRVEKGIMNIDEVCKVVEKERLDAGEYDEEICAICQDCVSDLRKEGDKVIRKTLCNHVYCDSCIQTWLAKNVRCPVCQVDLDEMISQKNK